jgi:hypothetical protein
MRAARLLLATFGLLGCATAASAEGAWVAWVHSVFHRPSCAQPEHIALGIVMVIDGLELHGANTAHVIAMARDRLSRMLEGTHYEDAKGLTVNTTYVYDWGGKFIRRELP